VYKRRAERLAAIADAKYDLYCALRTYESVFFDVRASMKEARRVLKPGGCIVISVSNGYLTSDGGIVRGQIRGGGLLDVFAPWKMLLEIGLVAAECKFSEFAFFDLWSEIGFSAMAPR